MQKGISIAQEDSQLFLETAGDGRKHTESESMRFHRLFCVFDSLMVYSEGNVGLHPFSVRKRLSTL